jgi:hypothetical protein
MLPTYDLKEVDMAEFKCDTRSRGYFLYGKKQSVFTVLYIVSRQSQKDQL